MAKNNSELKSIQKKLMAAIAMVLVASVMVVSSSYAWFTLSTAPEVTGIQTSVGSNGNLEMALRLEQNLSAIGTTSTAGGTFPEANRYWGNLVDLSDDSYHLDQLSLRPARLNATRNEGGSTKVQKTNENDVPLWTNDGGKTEVASETKPGDDYVAVEVYAIEEYMLSDKTTYLQTPVYGYDGRLSGLTTAGVINGTYLPDSNGFGGTGYGVRAVGTSSSMSPEEMALRTAKQAVSAAITNTSTNATVSLKSDSVSLATIFMLHILDEGKTYSNADVAAVQTAVDNLQAIILELDNALDQAVIALGVSQQLAVTKVVFTAANGSDEATIDVFDKDDTELTIDWSKVAESAYTDLVAAYTSLSAMDGDLTAAEGELKNLTDDDHSYTEMANAVTKLLDAEDFEINGYTMEDFQKLNTVQQAGIIFATPTISIVDGIYHDIAEFCENYSAETSIEVKKGTYMGVALEEDTDLPVKMATAADAPSDNGYYLSYVLNWLATVNVGDVDDSDRATLITDIYGYAIDLAFRTNAAGSNLLLQTNAANRVSSDSGELTQGSGSYMEFTSGRDDFTLAQVANLMGSIRVVFVDDNGNILGVAALDVTLEAVKEGEARVEFDSTKHYFSETVEETVDGEKVTKTYALQLTNAEVTQNGTAIKAPLYLYNYSVKDGVLTLNGQDASSIITALTQNTAIGISALVYLDGDTVENADVAINGNSMTGTMNLQFASSAQLDPMDYTFTAEQLETPTASFSGQTLNITNVENATSYKVTYAGQTQTIPAQEGATTSVDLSSILGSLATGEYTIDIVASAKGYTDSVKGTATYSVS